MHQNDKASHCDNLTHDGQQRRITIKVKHYSTAFGPLNVMGT